MRRSLTVLLLASTLLAPAIVRAEDTPKYNSNAGADNPKPTLPLAHGHTDATAAVSLPHGHPEMPAGHPPIPEGGVPGLPEGHPAIPHDATHGGAMAAPMAGMTPAKPAETDGDPIPLKKTGLGSAESLAAAIGKLTDADAKKKFETGFRYAFTEDRSLRRYDLAKDAFEAVLKTDPRCAAAYRALGQVAINNNFDQKTALEMYRKALEVDPAYGEAHYALAFMLTISDMKEAKEHFDKAMAAGVPDERMLKDKFFSGK